MMHPVAECRGVLFVGDAHLASRNPGFRRDDYPRAILEKLRWSLELAKAKQLVPCLLGDLFHWPRDNANWLLSSLLRLFDSKVFTIVGNHDCSPSGLSDDDSMSLLLHSGKIRRLSAESTLRLTIGNRNLLVGGSSWGEPMPEPQWLEQHRGNATDVVWLTHRETPTGADEGSCPGVDWVINGHIHLPGAPLSFHDTQWLTPGSLTRVKRGDRDRRLKPIVTELSRESGEWAFVNHEVPHAAFDEVFYPDLGPDDGDGNSEEGSLFVKGLAELEQQQTRGGVGLMHFLDRNLQAFDEQVASEVRTLAVDVLRREESSQ